MRAILAAIKNKQLAAECTAVLSNKSEVQGLAIAHEYKAPPYVIDPKNCPSDTVYEEYVVKILKKQKVELIILAGYMKIVGKTLLNAYHNKILNIHPALLPSFKGLHAQRQALEAGVKVSGCTVHFVNNELDGGPIILQEAVPVLETDTENTLSKRILEKEHQIYPAAIQLYAENRLDIVRNKVKIKEK